jgi:hypothetical protein
VYSGEQSLHAILANLQRRELDVVPSQALLLEVRARERERERVSLAAHEPPVGERELNAWLLFTCLLLPLSSTLSHWKQHAFARLRARVD